MKEKIIFGVFTTRAQKLVETQQDLFPEKYAQHITAAVVARENKNITLRSADFNKMTSKEIADVILKELYLTDHNNQQIAYLEGVRYERKLEQINPIEGTKAVVLRGKGTYLVTGGLGGVGICLCQHLAQKVSPRLIVTGQTRIPDRKDWEKWLKGHEVDDFISVKIKKLQKLEELCNEVIYKNVDVSNMEQMAQLIDWIESRYEKIDGIIHCAGVYDDAVIRNKSVEMFQRVMAPKVKGSWILTHLMRGKQLDFIHFCSSISALFGNEGQIDYCSANAFMDGLAAVDEKCISVNWSFWKDGGMDLTDGALKQLNMSGVVPLERKEALNAFDTINYVGCNNVTVAKFKNSMGVVKRETTESQETVTDFLINLMSRLLMIEVSEIDINMDFKYYGVDSLVLQDAVVELEKALGQSLEPSIFMDYPTIHLLSTYLNTKYTLDRPLKSDVELVKLPQEDEVSLKEVAKELVIEKVGVSSLREARMQVLEKISSGCLDLKDGMEKLSELEVRVYGQK